MGDTEPATRQLPGNPRGSPAEAGRSCDAGPDGGAGASARNGDRHRVPANHRTEGRRSPRHDANSYPNAAARNTHTHCCSPIGDISGYVGGTAGYTCRYVGGTSGYTHRYVGSSAPYSDGAQAYHRNRLVAGHG